MSNSKRKVAAQKAQARRRRSLLSFKIIRGLPSQKKEVILVKAPSKLPRYTVHGIWGGGGRFSGAVRRRQRAFKLEDFNAWAIKRVHTKANKRGFNILAIKQEAVLTCSDKSKQLPFDCSESELWHNISSVANA